MTTDEAYEWFRPTMEKLHAEGFKSICPDWWRSRWSEQCGFSSGITPDQHKLASERYHAFPRVWELYRYEFTRWPTHKEVRFAPPEIKGRKKVVQANLF